MQPFTLNQAAKACHKSKATLLEAIKNGRLSAKRDDKNQWQIDAAELFRVYPVGSSLPGRLPVLKTNTDHPTEPTQNHPLEEKIKAFEQERERERKQLQDTIDDLRKRLDNESTERRKLTALLTHQSENKPSESKLLAKLFKS